MGQHNHTHNFRVAHDPNPVLTEGLGLGFFTALKVTQGRLREEKNL